mmetsp:Transcript_8334/g.13734  ORF Transcript_8334/g.13734 Transcript_8334/m.13734 type:complete len:428 (-) Transcript_8334:96-1379(-)
MLSKHRSLPTIIGNLLRRHVHGRRNNDINAVIGTFQHPHHSAHCFFSSTSGGSETAPFDRSVKLKQRTRAAETCRQQHYYNNKNGSNNDNVPSQLVLPYDYFHREIAQRLVDRLDDINIRENGEGGFPLALEIGAGAGFVHEALIDGCADEDDENDLLLLDTTTGDGGTENVLYSGRGGVRKLVQLDSCSAMLHRDDGYATTTANNDSSSSKTICETYKLVAEEEGPFPFPDGTFDLVISSMAFHWINDLPRLLTEIKRVLKPDGCLLFALPGGNTLPELRSSLVLAELERTGGVSTHLGPYVDLSNVGSLLTGTGFKLPTIDVDDIQIGYPNMMVLMEHLGRMGEGNACLNRKERVGLGTFVGAACLYDELYPAEDNGDGEDESIVASAQIIYGIAWKEHEAQQKPLERGTATHKMTDIAVTKTMG